MVLDDGISDPAARNMTRQLDFTEPPCLAPAKVTLPEEMMESKWRAQQSPPQTFSQSQEQDSKSLLQTRPLESGMHLQFKLRSPGREHPCPVRPPRPLLSPSGSESQFLAQTMAPLSTPPGKASMINQVPNPMKKLPSKTYQIFKQDSPTSQVQRKDGTPKKQKHCNCKYSRCLKLYCECFAAGTYCDGCNCLNCHNNVKNEAARKEAIAVILERNKSAFKPKIASSPQGSQDVQEVQMVGKHNKGCHCKKSGCLKRYCECYQANILCSDKCRCQYCKNFEGSEEREALIPGNCNPMAYVQQAANAAINGAIGWSGYSNSFASKKRKTEGVSYAVVAESPSIQYIAHDREENMKSHAVSPQLSLPVSCTENRVVCGSSRSQYRSPLADMLWLQHVKELCSVLVAVSHQASKKLANSTDKRSETDPAGTNGTMASISSSNYQKEKNEMIHSQDDAVVDHRCGDQIDSSANTGCGSDSSGMQAERPLSPGTRALMCNGENITFLDTDLSMQKAGMYDSLRNGWQTMEAYAQQERLILTTFRSFLNNIVTYGSIKEKMHSPSSAERERQHDELVQKGVVRAGTPIVNHKEPYRNSIVKSTTPVTLDMPDTVSVSIKEMTPKLGRHKVNGKLNPGML